MSEAGSEDEAPPPSRREVARATRARRIRHLAAAAPLRLAVFSLVALVLAVVLATTLQTQPVTQVASATTPVDQRADPLGEQALVVLEVGQLSPEVVTTVERMTNTLRGVTGVQAVRSITNTPVVAKAGPLQAQATPAFGSRSAIDLGLDVRVLWSLRSRTGAADLVSPDGRTLLIAVTPEPGTDRRVMAARIRAAVERERAASPVPMTAGFGGSTFLGDAELDRAQRQLLALALLAVGVPVALVLAVFRSRVSATATLLASGASLLILATVLTQQAGPEGLGATLEPGAPAVVATQKVDERLHGTVPVQLELLGAPGVFRRPDVLARVDALGTWLEDVHQVHTSGLPGILRDEAGVVTGVDSVPPNGEDVDRLLTDAEAFDGGGFLTAWVSPDFSRAVLVGLTPDRGPAELGRVAANVDYVSGAVLADTGVVAHLTAGAPASGSVDQSLARAIAVLGLSLVALGIVSALVAGWARRHPEEEIIDLRAPDRPSLFARATHRELVSRD